jgi:hypothetical protein
MPERAAAEAVPASPPASDLAEAGARLTARRTCTLFEPVHMVSYFTAEPRQAFEHVGVRGFWRGYCAGRAAPLCEVGAAPVATAFFSFAPATLAPPIPRQADVPPHHPEPDS